MIPAFCVLLTLLSSLCFAMDAELVNKKNGQTNIVLTGSFIDRTQLKKYISSGLTNQLVFEINTFKNKEKIYQLNFIWKIYYDLWEEKFKISKNEIGKAILAKEFSSTDELFNAIESINLENIPIASADYQNVLIEIKVFLNPLSKESLEKAKKLAFQRKIPGTSNEIQIGAPEQSPTFKSLFNSILGHEIENSTKEALWQFSESIQIKRIQNETK